MHTDSPETTVAMAAAPQPPTGLRRRLIGAGLIGIAGSLVPHLAGRVGASVPEDTTAATTSTTTPPQQPTEQDSTSLGLVQSLELSAVQLYEMAIEAGSLSDETLNVVTRVHQSHLSYAQSLSGLLGRNAPGADLPALIDRLSVGFSGDETAFLQAAYELEDTAVATYTDLIEQLQGTDGGGLIASMVIAEAEHATVFADLGGQTDFDTLLLTNSEALAPGEG